MRLESSPTLPLTQVTSAAGTVDQSDLVDPSPKVDSWDPSSQRDGSSSCPRESSASAPRESTTSGRNGTGSVKREGTGSDLVEEEEIHVCVQC